MPFDDGCNIMYINGDIREAETIAECIGLPLEKVLELKKEIEASKA